MSIREYLDSTVHQNELNEMPILKEVIEVVSKTKPFQGAKIVLGHFMSLNSVGLFEGLWRGGAEITICVPFPAKNTGALIKNFENMGFPIQSVESAIEMGDFFVDNAGALGKHKTPSRAVEVTRTGDLVYSTLECPTISIDKSKLKYIEDYLGTGESFIRGWNHVNPNQPLTGKKIVLFGYGKVGMGVAKYSKDHGADVFIVDINVNRVNKAISRGYTAVALEDSSRVEKFLTQADIVVGATGIPNAIGESISKDWLMSNSPSFVNIGHDEFGEAIPEGLIVGGRNVPINFHLQRPTRNYKIDPIQAAEVLAVQELIQNEDEYQPGINPLPSKVDEWIMEKWKSYWPDEDLSEIEEELRGFSMNSQTDE